MTTPSADKASEDQRGQDRQSKKDKTGVDRSALERVHSFRGFDRRNRFAHDPPLDDVGDHEQIEQNEHGPSPAAGL